MNNKMYDLKYKLEKKILQLEKDFQKSKGLILTEDDLKCQLYKKFCEIDYFSHPKHTEDVLNYTIPLHTELTWFDDEGKLTKKPDMTIIEPDKISITHEYKTKLRLPSKQYSFDGDSIIFELKFIRNKTGIRKGTVNKIKKDFKKINSIIDKFRNKSNRIYGYLIIFNKTDIMCDEFKEFLEENKESENHKMIYCTGNVKF